MGALRIVLGLLLAGAAVWVLAAVFVTPPEAAPARAFTSSQQCRECHPAVYDEWAASGHAQAWINPAVRKLSNDFANTDCIDCHAPRPVFETGVGNRVLPRGSRRAEGVDCIACHLIPDELGGGVAATIDDPSAPCRPRQVRELASPEFCAGCHNQHQTVDQWRESKFFPATDCLECHMPFRDGDPNLGRSHLTLGGRDIEQVRGAVELRGVREDGRWVVEVENVAAGHHFPTDERSRAADVFWRPLAGTPDERGAWRHLYRFRSPYRHEVDLEDTLLASDEVRRIPLEPPAGAGPGWEGAGPVEVALFYNRVPIWQDPERPDPEAEAQLVARIELVP